MLIPPAIRNSPSLIRVLPFALFVLLTFCQDLFGEAARYWFYFAKTVLGAWMVWEMRLSVSEMRRTFSWEAVVAGTVVFVLWVGIDPIFRQLGLSYHRISIGRGAPWNPFAYFGNNVPLAWLFVAVHIVGSAVVVPPLEEVFFRSWLYRYIANPNFQSVTLGTFLILPFSVSSIIFGLEHREWLAGFLAGIIYAGLVCWKKRLGDAIAAHGVTNLLLGLWVVSKEQWQYW